jgi:hypothetical protein
MIMALGKTNDKIGKVKRNPEGVQQHKHCSD